MTLAGGMYLPLESIPACFCFLRYGFRRKIETITQEIPAQRKIKTMNLLIENKSRAIVVPALQTARVPLSSFSPALPEVQGDSAIIVPALSSDDMNGLIALAVSESEKSADIEGFGAAAAPLAYDWESEIFRSQFVVVARNSSASEFEFHSNHAELGAARYAAQKAVREGKYVATVYPPLNQADYSRLSEGVRPAPVYRAVAKNEQGKPVMKAPRTPEQIEAARDKARQSRINSLKKAGK